MLWFFFFLQALKALVVLLNIQKVEIFLLKHPSQDSVPSINQQVICNLQEKQVHTN